MHSIGVCAFVHFCLVFVFVCNVCFAQRSLLICRLIYTDSRAACMLFDCSWLAGSFCVLLIVRGADVKLHVFGGRNHGARSCRVRECVNAHHRDHVSLLTSFVVCNSARGALWWQLCRPWYAGACSTSWPWSACGSVLCPLRGRIACLNLVSQLICSLCSPRLCRSALVLCRCPCSSRVHATSVQASRPVLARLL